MLMCPKQHPNSVPKPEGNGELNAGKSYDTMKSKTPEGRCPYQAQGLELDGIKDHFQHKIFFDSMILE